MGKECEIKKYISVLPISKEEKEFINEKHNMVFNELKDTKKFRFVNGVLQAFKDKYSESLNEVAKINAKYGRVAAIVDSTTTKRVVSVNTISLLKDFESFKEIQQNTEKAEQDLAQDAKRAGVEYTEDYLFQKSSLEGIIASEKTIRDLAARMSDRIGIPVRFESDRSKEYKGKLENNVAYINLAYATLDTPIHEILGHPIIRAIRNRKYEDGSIEEYNNFMADYWDENPEKSRKEIEDYVDKNFKPKIKSSQLYQNLLKELETGRGKEVLDRIKRDYQFKGSKVNSDFQVYEKEGKYYFYDSLASYSGEDGEIEITKEKYESILNGDRYNLEEQQEEALVTLLGLMTAEKLDNVKDGKLISLLKRLLKELKAFVRSLLSQREVDVDKLPDNMTLGDLSDLLAYSNSKLILPGYEVEYTTPDNNKFKTYQEASNHISELAKNVKDVDLNNVNIKKYAKTIDEVPAKFNVINETDVVYKENGKWFRTYPTMGFNKESLDDLSNDDIIEMYNKTFIYKQEGYLQDFIEKNKEYEQSKEIIEEWKKVNNIQYNPEEIYSRGQEFSSVVGAYSEFDVNLMMQNLLSHIEDNEKANNHNKITSKDKIVFGHPGIGKTYLRESGRTDIIDFDSDYKSKINKKFNLPEGFKARNDFQKSNKEEYQKAVRELWNEAKKESKETNKQLFASDMILLREFSNDFDKVITMSKETFIERAKQRNDYTPGLEGTEGWKNSLDKEIAKVDKSKVINTNGYLSDLFSKGSGFAISAYTKPIDKQIGHLEGGGGKIKFKIYPQSQDILWAANTDVYSGSVWDASEKVNKDKKSELLGVSYTKYPSLSNINTVQPNLASIVDDLAHHHNELAVSLNFSNFEIEVDEDVPYQTKKIIENVNKILQQKRLEEVNSIINKLEKEC